MDDSQFHGLNATILMKELKLNVPTYNADQFPDEVDRGTKPESGIPLIPVLIREESGIRVVLGTHDYEDIRKPDVFIERQTGGWMIALHSSGGGDPSGYVFLRDDGCTFLKGENGRGGAIEVLPANDSTSGFGWPS